MADTNITWDTRMPHESTKAFTYFNTFLLIGPNRSLEKVRKEYASDLSLAQVKRYSAKYYWFARAEMYDEYKLHERQEQVKEEQEKYFHSRMEKLNDYHKLTDETLNRLLQDVKNPSTKTVSIANCLKNLTDANATNTKLALRFLGLPETINDKQDVSLDADVDSRQDVTYNINRSSDEFFDKQIDLINKMIESKKGE